MMTKFALAAALAFSIAGGLLAPVQASTSPPSKGGGGVVQDAVGDPIGDQQGADLDLLVVNAFTNGDSLTVELIADQPFVPPISGGIFIDIDQDASTGDSGVFDFFCPTHPAATGHEFLIAITGCTSECSILKSNQATTGAFAAASFDGNRAVFTAALADLGGDDGIADVEAIVGNLDFNDCGPGEASVVANSSITADYQFDGNLSSRTLNAPDATETRTGSAFTTESVFGTVRPVRTFDAGNGLRIDPTTGLITDSVYTIQMLIRIDDVSGGGSSFVKLIDYSDLSSDRGLYVTPGSGQGLLTFFDGVQVSGLSGGFPENQWTQVVMTRDIDRNITAYIDGVEQFTYQAIAGNTDVSGPLVFLDDDSATGGLEISAGAIACLRIHPTALDGAAVAELDCEPLRVGLNGNACAFSTISEAEDAAQSGDEIFIEVGTYNERIGQITGKDLTLRAAISGSNCTEPESVFSFNRAVVDGTGFSTFNGVGGLLDLRDSSVSLVAVDFTNGTTGQGGLVYVGPGSSFSTEGSTLSNGTASSDRVNPPVSSDNSDPAGGCVYAEGADVSFTITTFTNCRVIGPNGGADPTDGDGGAIHARDGSTVSGGLAVSFSDNSAREGGAIALVDSTADLSEILFVNNVSVNNGGAIAAFNSPVTLGFNSTFRDNAAGSSGGAISLIGQALDVTDAALFERNSASERGGAINIIFGDLRIRPSTDPVFFPSRFDSNTSQLLGGAIHIETNTNALPNPTIEGIEFVNNSSAVSGGALALLGTLDFEVVDSSFLANESDSSGGAVYSQSASSVFRTSENCKAFRFDDPNEYCSQFVGNVTAGGEGSALYYGDGSTGRVETTAFIGNSGPNAVMLVNEGNDVSMESVWFYDNLGDAVAVNADSVFEVVHGTFDNNAGRAFVGNDTSSLKMLNSIAFGNAGGGVASTGSGPTTFDCNIDQSGIAGPNTDPLFVNDGDGDSHLDRLSPAVNVCSEQAVLDVDLEGRRRSGGPGPDMGAFEFSDLFFKNGFEQDSTR